MPTYFSDIKVKSEKQTFPLSMPIRASLVLPGVSTTVSITPEQAQLSKPQYLQAFKSHLFTARVETRIFGKAPPSNVFKVTLKKPYDQAYEDQWLDSTTGFAYMDYRINVAGKYTVEVTAYPSRQVTLVDFGRSSAQFELLYPPGGIWDNGWLVEGQRRDSASVGQIARWFLLFSPRKDENTDMYLDFFYDGVFVFTDKKTVSTKLGESYTLTADVTARSDLVGHSMAIWPRMHQTNFSQVGQYSNFRFVAA